MHILVYSGTLNNSLAVERLALAEKRTRFPDRPPLNRLAPWLEMKSIQLDGMSS
jgi:hypothetical protein